MSYRLAQILEVFLTDAPPLARILPHLFDRDHMLMLVAPCVPDEDGERADEPEDGQPPDVPDDCKSADGCEESADHADRSVERHFDRLVVWLVDQAVELDRGLLASPIGLFTMDVGEHCEIVVR